MRENEKNRGTFQQCVFAFKNRLFRRNLSACLKNHSILISQQILQSIFYTIQTEGKQFKLLDILCGKALYYICFVKSDYVTSFLKMFYCSLRASFIKHTSLNNFLPKNTLGTDPFRKQISQKGNIFAPCATFVFYNICRK